MNFYIWEPNFLKNEFVFKQFSFFWDKFEEITASGIDGRYCGFGKESCGKWCNVYFPLCI